MNELTRLVGGGGGGGGGDARGLPLCLLSSTGNVCVAAFTRVASRRRLRFSRQLLAAARLSIVDPNLAYSSFFSFWSPPTHPHGLGSPRTFLLIRIYLQFRLRGPILVICRLIYFTIRNE